jgi:hypothetical protein
MREQSSLDSLKLVYSNTTGFHLSMSAGDFRKLQSMPAAQRQLINLQRLDFPTTACAAYNNTPPGGAGPGSGLPGAGGGGAGANPQQRGSKSSSTAPVKCTCKELETLNARQGCTSLIHFLRPIGVKGAWLVSTLEVLVPEM